MALYHLSVRVIGRSQGRSSVQVAAYQSRDRLHDERTGLHYDSRHKPGLIHAEILAPETAPDWMRERGPLWNGVERSEKRKDSQLARWFDVALPHELNHKQRLDLLREYVKDQWVSKGLIADIAIHNPDGDDRNHHAHILISMRAVTADGFGAKMFRGTHNLREMILNEELKAWADHQNRTFERLGLKVRVDHRSFEDRGIEIEPTKHMGYNAASMEKNGEASRIGEENRKAEQDNRERVDRYVEEAHAIQPVSPPRPRPFRKAHITQAFTRAVHDRPLTRLDRAWAQRDHERRMDLESRERHAIIDLGHKHQPAKIAFEAELERRNAVMKATIAADIDAIERRAKAKGVTRFFYRLTGRFNDDAHRKDNHRRTLDMIDRRENEERTVFDDRQNQEKVRLIEKYRLLRFKLERTLSNDSDTRNQGLQRMSEKSSDKRGSPPKLEPHYKPAPPRGAVDLLLERTDSAARKAVFERQVKDWAATPEGRAATQPKQKVREDWLQATPKSPEPSRVRDDWIKAAPDKTRAPPKERER